MKIAIIGAGITGLTVAYRLSQKGHQVTIFEKEKFIGGLTAGFKEKKWDWHLENFFHHLFASDNAAKNLITSLGLADKLFYTHPKTSIFSKGQITQFDSPFSVLTFPHLSFPDKIRTGLVTSYLRLTSDWKRLEKISAEKWLKKYYGRKPFQVLWQPLLKGKFGNQTQNISMTWFWARIKKRSPKLGYLENGFQVLIDKLAEKIKDNGGKIRLSQKINRKDFENEIQNKFDRSIITAPVSLFFKTPKLPPMLGAVNLILFLKKRFLTDGTYWLNINEPDFPFVAVVEHTNFINSSHYAGNHILYIGGYYPQNHRYFRMKKEAVLKEFLPFLQKIRPEFNGSSLITHHLKVNPYAQPVVPVNYSKIIPQMKTSTPHIYLANMQMVYPWDRGINYAIALGEKTADEISQN